MPERFVTRFAPSPTGYLHLGHAYSALTAFAAARAAGGRFLLRIEDIDRTRCRPEYEAAIYEDLEWLGLEWEAPVRRQSDHFADYAGALERLIERGLVYRCFKSRREVLEEIARAPHLAADGPEGPQYVGAPLPPEEEAARLAAGEPYAWRLSLAACRDHLGAAFGALTFTEEGVGGGEETGRVRARPEIFGDAIIARKDAGASYHLAAVHDDARQGITHVIRGADLFAAAHLHRLLQALLDLPAPAYRHHRLITDENGKKFSKRDRAVTLRALRAAGATRADILARLGLA
ncbi:tRNA glutamyl-Q(34) synthetase GluQRS [Amphiplicatus metriothermophilus]|uniref:Glutamyl-Q tRNA(Asp) synthetase n=1 Tax=Amphiplicatus metriothermophilus TaxID=1519374 RepID=A0A239PIU9_9PROT|nr:tRNA glutamyl-Q(34) synthetase GluQRS [Amphiplicatus metriothermophilus]MBB5517936.1 glutamyl-Q tRNA(Asp) synthetase [Amphiplicatus metriothermophilus]SNT67731.1 glutamyl-Q tRNA(Asp) synthetase [Amphiplicatus metriothermophilus]